MRTAHFISKHFLPFFLIQRTKKSLMSVVRTLLPLEQKGNRPGDTFYHLPIHKLRKVRLNRGLGASVLDVQTGEPEFRSTAPTEIATHDRAHLLSPGLRGEVCQRQADCGCLLAGS